MKGGRDSTCIRCEQVDDLLSVMKLMEKVERIRSTRECEQKIDCWSNNLLNLKKRHWGDIPKWWWTSSLATVKQRDAI